MKVKGRKWVYNLIIKVHNVFGVRKFFLLLLFIIYIYYALKTIKIANFGCFEAIIPLTGAFHIA